MTRRAAFRVSLVLPEDYTTVGDAREYVRDAVSSMKGCLFPGDDEHAADPMWGLDPRTVTVSHMRAVPIEIPSDIVKWVAAHPNVVRAMMRGEMRLA